MGALFVPTSVFERRHVKQGQHDLKLDSSGARAGQHEHACTYLTAA